VALVVVIAAVMSRTYVLLRRSAFSKRWACVIAVAVIPASYVLAVSVILLVVIASS
jgi:hypothetical protein